MAENRDYMTLPEEKGNINIAEEVIAAISVGAVREIEGVSGMMTGNSVTDFTSKKGTRKSIRGVKIDMTGDALALDLYLTVKYGYPIPEVAEHVQTAVSGSVEAMTGCSVDHVNVHVSGVSMG